MLCFSTSADLKSIPSDGMRLEGMAAKYPDAFGVVGLSRVGFNAAMNKVESTSLGAIAASDAAKALHAVGQGRL